MLRNIDISFYITFPKQVALQPRTSKLHYSNLITYVYSRAANKIFKINIVL